MSWTSYCNKIPFRYLLWATCDDVQLCNRCVREFLILAHTWFAFGLPSKTGCDSPQLNFFLSLCWTLCTWDKCHLSKLVSPRGLWWTSNTKINYRKCLKLISLSVVFDLLRYLWSGPRHHHREWDRPLRCPLGRVRSTSSIIPCINSLSKLVLLSWLMKSSLKIVIIMNILLFIVMSFVFFIVS
jgi:hypothetical protein